MASSITTSRFRQARTVYNPMRVITDGGDCEVVFTLRRQPDMSAEDFVRDVDAVTADLAALKLSLIHI